MSIHIGKIIHKAVKASHLTNKEFAAALHISLSSIYTTVFKKSDTTISRLVKISEILEVDLLRYYYTQGFLKQVKEKELDDTLKPIRQFEEEIKRLKTFLQQAEDRLAQKKETIKELQADKKHARKEIELLQNTLIKYAAEIEFLKQQSKVLKEKP